MKQELIRKLLLLDKDTNDKLRKYAYISGITQSVIVRKALDLYWRTPQPATDPNEETNYDHATMDMEELGNK
jgi:hypothetical protein